jgi:excisionase family DNA binding protein
MSGGTKASHLGPAQNGPSPAPGDRLLVAEEVAELLAVPESWVREATRTGGLPHIRLGRYVRYQRATVLAWIQDQRAKSARARVR